MEKKGYCPDCGKYRWNYDHTVCLQCNPPVVSKQSRKRAAKKRKEIDYRDHYYHEWIKSSRSEH
jgi:hypothetical protein